MPDDQTLNSVLSSYGMSNFLTSGGGFNWWNIIWSTLFGFVGLYAFIYGKKEKSWRPMVIGIVLMVYPFFVGNTWVMFFIGAALTAALYFWRE